MVQNNGKNGRERRLLKSSAKVREVDVKIGKNGLSPNVIDEIKTVLNRDRMVKVSFREDRAKRVELVQSIQNAVETTLIQSVGKTATFVL
jgi:RNA-binding protein YhbY